MSADFLSLISSKNVDIILVEDDREALAHYHAARFVYSLDDREMRSSRISIHHKNQDKTPIIFPDFRARYGDNLKSFDREFHRLMDALRLFFSTRNPLLIAPISSLIYPLPKKQYLEGFLIDKDEPIDFEALKDSLLSSGYDVVDIVELPGEMSVRGDILDICYVQDGKVCAYRLSFFDVICEEIRELDLSTQKSVDSKTKSILVPPAFLNLTPQEREDLSLRLDEFNDNLDKNLASFGFWVLGDIAQSLLDRDKKIHITENALNYLDDASLEFDTRDLEKISAHNFLPISIDKSKIFEFLTLRKNHCLTLIVPTELSRQNYLPRTRELGFSDECIKVAPWVVNAESKNSLILSLNSFAKSAQKMRPTIALNELKIGEFVVHRDYGIGIFEGIFTKKVMGFMRDFISINYQNEDKLLLPVDSLNLIDRFISNSPPILDRLGKGSFARIKERVKDKLFAIAEEIVALAARRDLVQGAIIDVDSKKLADFQDSAGFELTEDQKNAICEIMSDFRSGRVMDRLLSGDVGFGKTEVALNSIFAANCAGYQAALIVPTTLLCMQHFNTIASRGIKTARLDRFTKTKEKREILEGLKNGKIECVVGTHALLSGKFSKLGLIIIDEEHKFGVKQKEAIKQLSKDVHLLSMSATPIPRTLNMALSSIKSISTISTPPKDRVGVKTFVKEKSETLLKEAILRELRRNGQVIFVHNYIAKINFIKDELLALLPNLKISILHSQIDSKETENIMIDFKEGKFDLLLCTSIVESGIHLPNANTIIIDGADNFGLSDLHQLRGRVGRGDRAGFCYFLVDNKDDLSLDSKKRLLALEKNSFLGSGLNLAHQDLEIRGGGNVLGEAQSGHIKSIGFALYLKMLEDALHTLSGKVDIKEEVELNITVSAFINSTLIPSDVLRLELYRRLSLCKENEEVYEIENEITDRFGALDEYTSRFLELILIKIACRQKGITAISNFKYNVSLTLKGQEPKTFKTREDEDFVFSDILAYIRKL